MNIKRAKEEIEHTVKAYLAKDALGEYAIPAVRQRPILLMGPPGIGKTQIMEQAARECGVALVAYTITHHTRQSAVGLPFIRQRHYDGKDVSVTEYTMSEIIASIYAKMEATGLSEGILFIDEINCVSETLAPTMLQFLQCKTFGNQAVPAGWVIVAAGNPPEYNKSVRDFDIVTLDRVRRMDIEPDLQVWKDYARAAHLHSAIPHGTGRHSILQGFLKVAHKAGGAHNDILALEAVQIVFAKAQVDAQFPDGCSVIAKVLHALFLVAQGHMSAQFHKLLDEGLVADACADKGNLFALNKLLQLLDRQHKYLSSGVVSTSIIYKMPYFCNKIRPAKADRRKIMITARRPWGCRACPAGCGSWSSGQ